MDTADDLDRTVRGKLAEGGEVPEFDIVNRSDHRTAGGMPNDGDEFGPGGLGCEFQAARHIFVDDISRQSGVEDIAKALVEDQLGGCARIETAHDGGEGLLPSTCVAGLGKQVAPDSNTRGEPFVARFEQGKSLVGR